MTLPNNLAMVYAYDNANQLTGITYKQGSTTLGDLTYAYGTAGRRTTVGGTWARSGLPVAATAASITLNANNQALTFAGTTMTYDLNGNPATAQDASGTATYTWDVRNRLTGLTSPGFSASFAYDALGRRTGKTVQGVTTNYVYDGLNPVQEKDGSTVTANLLTGLGGDQVFTRTDGTITRELFTDALGSTVALADTTGAVQTSYTYEAFGGTTQTGGANTNSYKYTGREDDGTGLYYYRARYYSPRLQRFVSEDPIGFAGSDANLYRYVGGNPVSNRDPSGLGPISFWACTGLNAVWQVSEFARPLSALEESTRGTLDLLDKVKSEIAQCPSKDTERLGELERIRSQLNRQLIKPAWDYGANPGNSGVVQVAEGLVWEGACAAAWFLPWYGSLAHVQKRSFDDDHFDGRLSCTFGTGGDSRWSTVCYCASRKKHDFVSASARRIIPHRRAVYLVSIQS